MLSTPFFYDQYQGKLNCTESLHIKTILAQAHAPICEGVPVLYANAIHGSDDFKIYGLLLEANAADTLSTEPQATTPGKRA
jgi:hypothetical protein